MNTYGDEEEAHFTMRGADGLSSLKKTRSNDF